jgi:hypothetical protein
MQWTRRKQRQFRKGLNGNVPKISALASEVACEVLHIKSGQEILGTAAEPQTQYQALAMATAGYEAIHLRRRSLQHHSVLPKLEECADSVTYRDILCA